MPEQLTYVLINSATVISGLMLTIWLISLILKDASVVDLIWGLGFVLVAWTSVLTTQSNNWILPLLTTVWGLRLSGYLAWRNYGQSEDYRYRAMRDHHGKSFPLVSIVTVFGLQGLIMWIVSLPLQAGAIATNYVWKWLLIPGVVLWAIGLCFETLGDWQLARFKANRNNSGAVLDSGLWRYTRHPNYFGDFAVWWGVYFVAMAHSGAWWTVIGPIVMSVFLMRVSGVTLLEKSLTKTKPQYADYIARTNAFFPGPPRSASADAVK